MNLLNLNTLWNVREEPMSSGPEKYVDVLEQSEGWMSATLPTDVRVPLIENGIIQDPIEALASFDSEWVEERSWWFKKIFDADEEIIESTNNELVIESIDAAGDVFLNGRHLGHHRSAHYPFIANVTGCLKTEGNLLVVRVTVGAEVVTQEQAAPFKDSVNKTYRRGDERRVFLRKPQYVFGWDWGPRIATCGLVKDVYLRSASALAVRSCDIHTSSLKENSAVLSFSVEVENLHDYETREARIEISLASESGGEVITANVPTLLQSGLNYVTGEIAISNPDLWWPNGIGNQSLYIVNVHARSGEYADALAPFSIGIRTVSIDMSDLGSGERMFAIVVNGKKVFCRGGNWIPADSVYGRVSDDKYRTLIEEAKEANFTMLRIWGGGLYERDIFYETCDRLGILVWHDFMFGCALYPDDRDWFRAEVEREIDYQTRRLRNHPSMALWCGNNENHWGFHDWWVGELQAEFAGGAEIYNRIAPRIVNNNCPHIPYWRSSPYGGSDPNGNALGDRHHWHDCTMNPDMEKRITPEEYDKVTSKFVSEYGYIGPCAMKTIEEYHAGESVERFSELWNWHNNTFEKDTVVAGIAKHYVDADGLPLDSYLLYAGLVQGLMYGYSLESIRFVENCWGSLFWMYNDCWGEVGWTIIDYYLRRKPSYYYVKRTFKPVAIALRRSETTAVLLGANDTGDEVEMDLEYGYISFDGEIVETTPAKVTLHAHDKGVVLEFDIGRHDETKGTYFAREVGPDTVVEKALLRSGPFRNLSMKAADVQVLDLKVADGVTTFSVTADTFAHAVHFGIEEEYRLSDSFFDILPGEIREVRVDGEMPEILPKSVAPGQ